MNYLFDMCSERSRIFHIPFERTPPTENFIMAFHIAEELRVDCQSLGLERCREVKSKITALRGRLKEMKYLIVA